MCRFQRQPKRFHSDQLRGYGDTEKHEEQQEKARPPQFGHHHVRDAPVPGGHPVQGPDRGIGRGVPEGHEAVQSHQKRVPDDD